MALRSVARPRAESMERAATHSRDGEAAGPTRLGGSARGSRGRFRGLSGGQPDSPRLRVESGCDKVAPHAGAGVGMVSGALS